MSSCFVKHSFTVANNFLLTILKISHHFFLKMKEKKFCILKQMFNSQHCRSNLTTANSNIVRFLCERFVNVFLEHVSANKSFIESTEVPFEKTVDSKFSIREKRKVLANKISLVKSIGNSCYIEKLEPMLAC